jgi:hypothetical protein
MTAAAGGSDSLEELQLLLLLLARQLPGSKEAQLLAQVGSWDLNGQGNFKA